MYERILVIGTSCSGKTTFARAAARRLALPHAELDALFWRPDWAETPRDEFRARVRELVAGPRWIVEGHEAKVRDLVWRRADLVVWLDYALPLVLWRSVRRSVGRAVTGETLWNGNRERLTRVLFSRQSPIAWVAGTYQERRREYNELFERRPAGQLAIRLRSPREARVFLSDLPQRL